jgi:uncharacterized OB-fold protein
MTIPIVERDDTSAPFFDAAAQHTLMIKRCPDCAAYGPPRQRHCGRCGAEMTWSQASGEARLVTWTASPAKKGDESETRFGYVELAEGPWLETLLVDPPIDGHLAGTPMHVTFLHPDGGESLPAFTANTSRLAGDQ